MIIQAVVSNGRSSVDIHLHETYIVIQHSLLYLAGAVLLTLLWVIYLVTRNILASRYLIWMHVVATLLLLVVIYTGEYWFVPPRAGIPYDYYKHTEMDYEYYSRKFPKELTIALLSIAGQLFFIINLLYSIGRYVVKGSDAKRR